MSIHRYTARRVNPFRGVMRVIDLGEARALSVDALNWELQVKVERPVGWGSLNLGRTEILYSRYGVWSAAEGLASYPVHPTLDRRRVHRAAEQLVEALAGDSDAEFPLADRFEHWLLDHAGDRPLALLASAIEAPPEKTSLHWRAAPNDDAEFTAAFGRDQRIAVERLVGRRGGTQAWFERLADGSAVKVGTPGVLPSGRAGDTALAAACFPELLLADDWPQADAPLLASYRDWLAPRLLMLPLAASTRRRLEQAAALKPDDVAHFFHLYPDVADIQLMNSLRVQARLVRAG